jgi:phospholipase/carboxylesterase
MRLTLQGPSRPPRSGGKPKSLVVLLHGLGSDGNDLISLAPYWAPLLPETEFLAPNAPFPCDMAPFGYQWFSFQERTPTAVLAGVRAAAPFLDAFLDEALEARGLDESRLALVGFSQGTMMSLHVGLRRAKPVAGIIGYSGRLIAEETLAGELRSKPPVLLMHGTADEIVPFDSLTLAEASLKALGVPVTTVQRPGLGHSIDEIELQKGGEFLSTVLAPHG